MNDTTIHHHEDPTSFLGGTSVPDPHQDTFSKTILGFWMYLMNDCLLFGTLFTTYFVLRHETFGGPSGKDIFSLETAFAETMVLLFSSLTCGLAVLAAVRDNRKAVQGWLIATFILGLTFLSMEIIEFRTLLAEGHSWTVSAFLSAFYTLVGTHGLHITVGLIWSMFMLFQVQSFGLTADTFRRLVLFNLFWHFLDLVWIFIFTFVYLEGVIR